MAQSGPMQSNLESKSVRIQKVFAFSPMSVLTLGDRKQKQLYVIGAVAACSAFDDDMVDYYDVGDVGDDGGGDGNDGYYLIMIICCPCWC